MFYRYFSSWLCDITTYALLITRNQVFWVPTNDGSSSRNYNLARGTNNETSLWTWNILRNVLDWGVWGIYGQVDLIDHDQADGSTITGKMFTI